MLLYYPAWACCSSLLSVGVKIVIVFFPCYTFIFLYVFTYFSNTRRFMPIFLGFVMPADFIPLVVLY